MNQETIINKMSELKLEGFKTAYLRQIENRNYDKLSFNEKLYNLLESQDTFQHNRKIQMNFKMSKIKDKKTRGLNIVHSSHRVELKGTSMRKFMSKID